MDKARTSPEFDRFNALVGKVLSVPKTVLDQRERDYQQGQSKTARRSPKSKKTPKKA